jgi:hypothetical protein
MALNLNFLKPQSAISNMPAETDFIVIGSKSQDFALQLNSPKAARE